MKLAVSRVSLSIFGALALACQASTSTGSREVPKNGKADEADSALDTKKKHPLGTKVSIESELREVEGVRGLAAKRKVEGRTIDGRELAGHLEKLFSENLPEKPQRGTEDALRLLELAPVDFDYDHDVALLLRVGLAGLYEPREKVMFLRRELSPLARRYTLLHELTHSLQDQHFDLSPFVGFHPGDSDRIAALSAVIEGDAMLTMMEAALRSEGRHVTELSEAEILSGPPGGAEMADPATIQELEKRPPPRFLLRSLAAPYQIGVHFMLREFERGGFRALDSILAHPPTTTEQVLHPEKFASREAPSEVSLPRSVQEILGERGFEVLLDEPLGELGLRTMFEEWEGPQEAERAAAGWNGDRFVSYGTATLSIVVGVAHFDSKNDAEEASASLARQYLGKIIRPDECAENESGSRLVARSGSSLLIALGTVERSGNGSLSLTESLPFGCNVLSGWNETH